MYKINLENTYQNYTGVQLIIAVKHLQSLIYTRETMGDKICELNQKAYEIILKEIEKRGII
jgi:hypothetical protein